jgi:hypothetical protein
VAKDNDLHTLNNTLIYTLDGREIRVMQSKKGDTVWCKEEISSRRRYIWSSGEGDAIRIRAVSR